MGLSYDFWSDTIFEAIPNGTKSEEWALVEENLTKVPMLGLRSMEPCWWLVRVRLYPPFWKNYTPSMKANRYKGFELSSGM